MSRPPKVWAGGSWGGRRRDRRGSWRGLGNDYMLKSGLFEEKKKKIGEESVCTVGVNGRNNKIW